MCQIETHEVHHDKRLVCKPVISPSLDHHSSDSAFGLVSTPISRVNSLEVVEPPTSLPRTSREDSRLDSYLEYPHATHYIHPCLLRDSNIGPTAYQSASQTTIPNG
ncbi:uncharacterized protein TNCV_1290871 [Trichonephila clavipes]|nr:uncharacterized protein TNCV_1290871 [Trichonephila clavipes]